MEYTVLHSASISCKAGPLGASDNTMSSWVIIVVVTQIQGEPSSQKAVLCFEESGLLFFFFLVSLGYQGSDELIFVRM